ncbi:succinate-semialdehyde dehydrogenase, mitochondrial [Strongylocentrotus purpuratus]|uniref:Aldehyde dehydrogenase domain-containing protein n=1 Tax=Strongylocentrotus purpuratus TaxID=7668 RepID=A0A7M7PPM4_STRPU|nr:succinate-semialdehyde dehydrogenase, mitochondrial-like [Strongylocentrotus purpuratus]XP_793662.1 succinate-semialdehyde dehydrogenase, mitochondrial [Strongylocentrotus purpuratus]|eukprot:XP_011676843.1 PREDICTED: succinate-semialdehyde dehydrogenase, mitochondrial [Strongylocentrotus purpuratus]
MAPANPLIRDKSYIGGAWVPAKSGATFAVTNPATGELIANVTDSGAADTDRAIDVAHTAFKTWKKTTATERAAILNRFAQLMDENVENLAKIIIAENGKKMAEAQVEAQGAASCLRYYAEEATRTTGDVLVPHARGKRVLVIRQPVGVAGLITPWNFPLEMITRKAGAALAVGCTMVIKPSEDTPLSALALCDMAKKAGVPDGVFNVVPCSRPNAPAVGKVMCESLLVSKISFTGSTAVGKILLSQAASTVKKVSLELGGNSPLIVFDSANLEAAVMGAFFLRFYGAGQVCVSANRILVQEGIYDKFCEKMKQHVSGMVVGNGMDPKTSMGPLINQRGVEKVERHVQDAVKQGARILTGGNRSKLGGNFFEPTVICDVPTTALPCTEETFGPLASIVKFKTEEEAITIANNTRMGLAGYFYSNDMSQIWRVAEEMEVGQVGINDTFFFNNAAPFGGVKESGLGVESSKYGLHEFQNIKTMGFGLL